MASNVSVHGRQYRLRWRLRDGSQQIFSHADKHHVERLKLWLETSVDERDVPKLDDRITRRLYLTGGSSGRPVMTLSSLSEAWLAERIEAERVGLNSARNYRCRIARFGDVGEMPIEDVTEEILRGLVAKWKVDKQPTTKRPYSSNTIRETLSLLSSVLNWATVEGRIPFNPARKIAVPKQADKKQDKFLTRDEFTAMQRCTASPDLIAAMDFMVGSGCRVGEMLALRCNDLSFDGEYYTVRIDESFHSDYGPTKTKKTRFVDVLPDLGEQLSARVAGRRPSEPIFPNPYDSSLPWSYSSFAGYWDSMVDAARANGVAFPKGYPTPHWLRHTHAAWILATNECSIYELSERLGHTSITVTVDMYAHLDPQARKRVMRALSFVHSMASGRSGLRALPAD